RASHVGEQRLAVFVGTVQTAITAGVTHDMSPLRLFALSGSPCVRAALLGAECPVLRGRHAPPVFVIRTGRRNAWPDLRCFPAASPQHPYRDAGPCPRALP